MFRIGLKPQSTPNRKQDLRCIPVRGGVVCRTGRKPIEGITDHDFIFSNPVNVPDGGEFIGIVVRKLAHRVLAVGYPRKEEQENEAQDESWPYS